MLEKETYEKLLSRALRRGGDYADIFCEHRRAYAFRLQDGKIHEGSSALTLGVGVRVVVEALGSMVAHGKLGQHKSIINKPVAY